MRLTVLVGLKYGVRMHCFRLCILGQLKQSGRTPWRAASLCVERKALWRDSDTEPVMKKNKHKIISNPLW